MLRRTSRVSSAHARPDTWRDTEGTIRIGTTTVRIKKFARAASGSRPDGHRALRSRALRQADSHATVEIAA